MKNIFVSILTISLIFAAFGCKSKKTLPSVQEGSTEVSVPFASKEYRSDGNFFRASQSGRSPDRSTAHRIALLNAKTELAGAIESTMKSVATNYINQRTVGERQEYASRFDEESRAVVNQTLNDVKIIGERTFQETGGGFTVYIAVEMSKDALMNAMNDRISRDERLKLDFDQHQFRKVFDEEMRKFENR